MVGIRMAGMSRTRMYRLEVPGVSPRGVKMVL